MKRHWTLFAAVLLLTACGTAATATSASAPAATGEADAYVASDPAAFAAAAGRPQLVEFFAFW